MISIAKTDFQQYLRELREAVELNDRLEGEHRERAARARAQLEHAEGFLHGFNEWRGIGTGVQRQNTKRHGHISSDELKNCGSQAEALREIARRSGGYCNATEAAPIVIGAGLTTSKKLNSVASTLQKVLSNESEWERPARGLYRWIQYEASEDRELAL